jgi:hypothetical protein
MFIKSMMFIALSVYSMLDYYQTLSLIQFGHEEINPVVLWLIGPNENWTILLVCKISFLALLGTTIVLQHIKKKRRYHYDVVKRP